MAPVRPPPLSDVSLAPVELAAPFADGEQPPMQATGTLLGRTSNFMPMAGKKSGEAAATPVKPLTAAFSALETECMASPGALRRTPMAAFTPISTPSPSQRCSLFSRDGWSGSRLGLALASMHAGAQEAMEGGEVALHPWQPGLQGALPVEGCGGQDQRHVVSLQQALHTLEAQALSRKQVAATAAHATEEGEEDSEVGDADDQEQRLRTLECAPRPPAGALHPSLGSEGHALGVCKRCCFFPRGRCMNGYNCEFCHYEHEKRKRKNKKGSKVVGTATYALPPHLRGLLCQPQSAAQPAMPTGFAAVAQARPQGVYGMPQQLYPAHSMQSYQAPAMAHHQPLRPPGNNGVLCASMGTMSMVPMQAAQGPPCQVGAASAHLVMAGVPAQHDYCQAQPTYMMAAGTSGYAPQHLQQHHHQQVQQSNMQVLVLDPAYMPQQVAAAPMQPQLMCYHGNF